LDKQLENKRFFCGEDITIADIQYYCEISTIVALTKKEISAGEYPNLAVWYNEKLSKLPDIDNLERRLKDIVGKFNF
jgi:glutathione S-transferase